MVQGRQLYTYAHVHYHSVPDKRPWVLYHNSLVFTTLGAYLVHWVLIMCQIMYKLVEISGWSQSTIAIVMATQSRSPLASAPVIVKAVALSLNIEASYTKLVTLLPRFSCLLWTELMHDRANFRPCLCVATFGGTCLDANALWCACVDKLPGRLPYVTIRI